MLEGLIFPKDTAKTRAVGLHADDVLVVGLSESDGGSWGPGDASYLQAVKLDENHPRHDAMRAALIRMQSDGEQNPKLKTPHEKRAPDEVDLDGNVVSQGRVLQYSTVKVELNVDADTRTRIRNPRIREPILDPSQLITSTRPDSDDATRIGN